MGPAVFGNQQDDQDLHDELVSYDWPTQLTGFGDHWLGLTNPGFRSSRDDWMGLQYGREHADWTYLAGHLNTRLESTSSGVGMYTFPGHVWAMPRAIAETAPAGWYNWLTYQLGELLGPTKPLGSSWQFDYSHPWSTVSNPTYDGSSYVEDEFQALAAALQSIEDQAKARVTSERDELDSFIGYPYPE